MTLFLIGLGLGDEKDITIRGLEIIKQSNLIFLEHYTSILSCSKEQLEKSFGKPIIFANRTLVEQHAQTILEPAKTQNVAFLVVGDPFGATTHTDLVLRAKEMGITVNVIHNASIMSAIGETGLELYKFGKTTSIPFHEGSYKPQTPYDVIKENSERGLHTLCLLDIKINEPSQKDLIKGSTKDNPPRFMTIHTALEILTAIEQERKEGVITDQQLVIGIARLGQENQFIKSGTWHQLLTMDFGGPLHSLIIPGKLHEIEEKMLKQFE